MELEASTGASGVVYTTMGRGARWSVQLDGRIDQNNYRNWKVSANACANRMSTLFEHYELGSWVTQQQCDKTGKDIALLAHRINFQVRELQLLAAEAAEEAHELPIRVEIHFETCPRLRTSHADADNQLTEAELLYQDVWPTLRELSRAVNDTQQHFSELPASRQLRLTTFYSALIRLGNALHRQRRYLPKVRTRQVAKTKIEAKYACESCDETNCQARYVPWTDKAKAQLSGGR